MGVEERILNVSELQPANLSNIVINYFRSSRQYFLNIIEKSYMIGCSWSYTALVTRNCQHFNQKQMN